MLMANGIGRTLDDWARQLGIPAHAIAHSITEGLTMQDVVELYTTDTFESCNVPVPPRPSTPPNLVRPYAEAIDQSPGGSFTFRTLCLQCAEVAKAHYDIAHTAHKAQARADQLARERAENNLIFEFVNYGGTDAAGPSVQSPQAPQDKQQGPQAE